MNMKKNLSTKMLFTGLLLLASGYSSIQAAEQNSTEVLKASLREIANLRGCFVKKSFE